jgi:hypothetical protein
MKNLLKIVLVLPLLFFFVACSNNNPESSQAKKMKNKPVDSPISIIENNIDLGEIPIMGGKVTTTFTFKNTGSAPVALFEGSTS